MPWSNWEIQVQQKDPDRFITCLFLPKGWQKPCLNLLAFDLELSRIPQLVSNELLGHIRLQWWLDALERLSIKQGQKTEQVLEPESPEKLLDDILSAPLSPKLLMQMIEGYRFTLEQNPYQQTEDQRLDSAAARGGGLMRVLGQVCKAIEKPGPTPQSPLGQTSDQALNHLGTAWTFLQMARHAANDPALSKEISRLLIDAGDHIERFESKPLDPDLKPLKLFAKTLSLSLAYPEQPKTPGLAFRLWWYRFRLKSQ